ncbi:Rpn family recombination-promoting nuclease/putative transposase [Candidatus Venteria ishoeyi]|uniref:PD-(D/E)XK nuclease family transposase n=1 Tax=Candidatus Venteria ishoeyi TaxID=1899563 RepID=A0A1H6F2A7_9GAMM|nr:Rpn family recombination-promoting nuclease/putative transposase [Candidatus Venteria ishoeyi]SEH04287.1 PD-(D/E)XK nuclease family transposase [Candidatus Venteria ishoeyi]
MLTGNCWFGTEPNKDLLIDFLNELLRNETGEIKELTYLSPEQLGRSIDDRKAIYDIYCENEKGEKFIVELQKAKQNYFKDRSIYYSTFPIQQQALKGEWNFKLNAIYTIGILDFVFAEDKNDNEVFHHEVQLFDKSTQKIFFDKLTYIYLEMPKFKKTEAQLKTHFDKWLYLLKNLEHLTNRPAKLQERIFQKLLKQAEIANYNEQEYAEYEESLKVYRDLKNSIDTAFDDGRLQGRAEGIEKGMEKGILQTARKLKQAGVAVDVIVQTTGLTVKEIENLEC